MVYFLFNQRKQGFPLVLRSEFLFHGVDASVLCALRIPFGRAQWSTFPQPPQIWRVSDSNNLIQGLFFGFSGSLPFPHPNRPQRACVLFVWLMLSSVFVLSSFQLFVSLALKSLSGEWSINYVCMCFRDFTRSPGDLVTSWKGLGQKF